MTDGFNSDYEEILLLLDLTEKNTIQNFKVIRTALERIKSKYEQRTVMLQGDNEQ